MLNNLFESVATELTLKNIKDSISTLVGRTNGAADAFLISGSKKKYRREFTDTTLSEWNTSIGSGMTLAANAATGQLVLTSGTTSGSETYMYTKTSFTAPFRVNLGLRINQKVSNFEFYFELVAENDDGTLDETVVASWRIAGSDSTIGTVARYEARNGESTRLSSGNATVQNHLNADAIMEIALESDEVWFSSKAMDAASAKNSSYVRNSVSPDPNRKYRVRLRAKNSNTTASSTTVTAYFLTSVDYTEQQVEVTGGNGASGVAQSIPVKILESVTVPTNTSISNNPGVTLVPNTAAVGLVTAKVRSVAGLNSVNLKTTAARFYGYEFSNNTMAWRYVRIVNKSSTPTSGDAAAITIRVVGIPAGQTVSFHTSTPIAFGNGLSYVIGLTGLDDEFSTGIGATDVIGSIDYL